MAVRIDPEHNERFALQLIGARFDRARVLEVGCGDGRLTRFIAGAARSVVAIDADRSAVAELRAGGVPANVDAVAVDFESFATDDRFDAVVFSWSL